MPRHTLYSLLSLEIVYAGKGKKSREKTLSLERVDRVWRRRLTDQEELRRFTGKIFGTSQRVSRE